MTRAAYADAFRKVTGRPLVRLPQMAGRTESEIFFEAVALNQADPLTSAPAGEEALGRFAAELTLVLPRPAQPAHRAGPPAPRRPGGRDRGGGAGRRRADPSHRRAQANAIEKLQAFALEPVFDTEVGGYGSEVFPQARCC